MPLCEHENPDECPNHGKKEVMEKRIRLDAIENGLVVAGFNPSFVRDLGPSRGLYIGFEGEIAQEVINILVRR